MTEEQIIKNLESAIFLLGEFKAAYASESYIFSREKCEKCRSLIFDASSLIAAYQSQMHKSVILNK